MTTGTSLGALAGCIHSEANNDGCGGKEATPMVGKDQVVEVAASWNTQILPQAGAQSLIGVGWGVYSSLTSTQDGGILLLQMSPTSDVWD